MTGREEIPAAIRGIDGVQARAEVEMRAYTSIGIGGPCRVMAAVRAPEALGALLRAVAGSGWDVFPIGEGTNLLVSDRGFEGLVLRLGVGFRELVDLGGTVTVGAAFPLKKLAARGVREGWGGMEHFGGLPGTVGGAVRMNAGAWGREIWDLVRRVDVVDPAGGERTVKREEARPAYRNGGLPADLVVTRVELAYERRSPTLLRKRLRSFMLRRKRGQAIRLPSFGSVFRNPEGFHAGELIDSLGLKGHREGGAMIAREHANFIVNLGEARAADVLALMRRMRGSVLERYGVALEPEVVLLGFENEELEGVRCGHGA